MGNGPIYNAGKNENFDIQFLPDRVVQEFNHQANILTLTNTFDHSISTEMLSNQFLLLSEIFHNLFPIHTI